VAGKKREGESGLIALFANPAFRDVHTLFVAWNFNPNLLRAYSGYLKKSLVYTIRNRIGVIVGTGSAAFANHWHPLYVNVNKVTNFQLLARHGLPPLCG
jgi:hypothetical protein